MNLYKTLIFFFVVRFAISAQATNDSITLTYLMDEISVSAIKQGNDLYAEPLSATVIPQQKIALQRTLSIKDAAVFSPNFYIPNYGSRITSSIYVRGLGARIDNPVIGLNVDNTPYLNKNAFDVDVIDIARMEMVRGPQSTMYGRNTMGGVINIYTLSPFAYQGWRMGAEYGNGNSYKLRASYYDQVNHAFAYSAGVSYGASDGFFTNEHTGELTDWEKQLNARLKLQYRMGTDWRIENTTSFSQVTQGGYPYLYIETGLISYNDVSSYDRMNVNNGLSIRRTTDWGSMTSITSYAYLDDVMHLDQDFTPQSYFNMLQATDEHNVSEDFVIKFNEKNGYNALFGAFAMFKNQNMRAPVTFKEYGIEQLILKNMNEQLAPYYYVWNAPTFLLDSDFTNRISNVAFYHESAYEVDRFRVAASLRADYERNRLRYHSSAQANATLYDKSDAIFRVKDLDVNRRGVAIQHFFALLPKLSLRYALGERQQSTMYFSIGRGHKAGGFNTQMFSDILQQDVMTEFGVGEVYDVDKVISYKPEYNWTYELGTHIEDANRDFIFDASLFYIDCYNQQLTVFPQGQTTGRMMTNAGRTRSLGGELSANVALTTAWDFNLSYGYTNARFTHFVSGNDDFRGKFVPYAPQHTLYAGTTYTFPMGKNRLVVDVNTRGVGKIYWNEQNSISQPFYILLNGTIAFEQERFTLSLWAKNISNTQHDVFYFKSIGREFVQRGNGITFGATISVNLQNNI